MTTAEMSRRRLDPARDRRSNTTLLGLRRGLLELRQTLRSPREVLSQLSTPVILVLAASLQKGTLAGTSVPASASVIAGGVATMLSLLGLITMAKLLAEQRQDGTLLRVRAVPGATLPYLFGKVVTMSVLGVAAAAVTLAGGVLFLGVRLPSDAGHWLTLLWVVVLGLAAVVPLGAAIGALLPNPREALALLMLPILGLLTISGVFFPISIMPRGLQILAEVFPLAWIGRGIRSAILPPEAVSAEAGAGWMPAMTAAVLLAWTVFGLLAAPRLIRRSALRANGKREPNTVN